MSRFMLTQIGHGVAPDGTAVVSAENLERTWEPQVPVDADVSYGLGWFVDTYKEQPLMHHGGNMLGFTSDLAFLPEAGIGIVVLTNGQVTNLFNEAVRYRFLELVFEQEPEFHEQVEAILQGQAELDQHDTGAPVPSASPVASPVAAEPADAPGAEAFAGTYVNDALGTVTLELEGGRLYLDTGEVRSGLWAIPGPGGNGGSYLMADPPMAGLPVELRRDGDVRSVVVGTGATQHIFLPAGAMPAATPAATPAAA
jgi:hypothetical protein